MSLPALIELLEREHGLRFDALTADRLRRALARGDADPELAARRALTDARVRSGLLDHVTLQESSFFRDPPVWTALAQDLLPAAIGAGQGGPLVIWSAGCANGQEAWSLAMLLHELGAPRFEVVASDLSAAAVARTVAGDYDERELRGLSAQRRDRFMVQRGGRWHVADALRASVRVVHQNVATDPPPVADGTCALVLCRYLLIYLAPGAARELLARFDRALGPDGRLVVGAAESLWHLTERFTAVGVPQAVTYRRRRAADPGHPREVLRRMRAEPGLAHPPRERGQPDPSGAPVRRHAPTTALADTGSPPPGSQDAASLTAAGEAAAARGDLPGAVVAFRGAVFLDPDAVTALVGLGLALEALGDEGAARAFRAAWTAMLRVGAPGLEAALGGFAAAELLELVAAKLGRAA